MAANNINKLYFLIVLAIVGCLAGLAMAAPIISLEEPTTLSDTQFIITWQTTNEASTTGIQIGIGETAPTVYSTNEGASRATYHYLILNNLYPNTTYRYRIMSVNEAGAATYGEYKTFTTLNPPSGQLLFTFAVLADTQVATDVADSFGARGRPYSVSDDILTSAVSLINLVQPNFTVIKGDLIDSRSLTPAAQANTVKTILGGLTSTLYPIPGNHDKAAFVVRGGSTSDWYNLFFKDLRANTAAAAAPATDSIYNYSVDLNGYHLIFLDSVKQNLDGQVDTAWLSTDLAANTDKKSLIFLHYVITPEAMAQIPPLVIREVIGAETVDWNKIDLTNRAAFLSVLATYEANIAAIFMGHIHDNARYYIPGFDFPFIRTGATIQFPIGFNIYKVYANGLIQSFYKVPTYTELSRANITPEGGYSDSYWELQAVGTGWDRNFVLNYDYVAVTPSIEGVAPGAGAVNVALNQPLIITFSRPMAAAETQNAVSFSPAVAGQSYTWNSDQTRLTVSHDNFTASTPYTVTVATTAKSSAEVTLAAPFIYSFTTGTAASTTPPAASLNKIVNDITDDATPTFTGLATDENSTIANVEYRIRSGTWRGWQACVPLDGAFDSLVEAFTFTVMPEVSRENHLLQIRTTNAAGAVTTSGFTEYQFYMVGARPLILLTINSGEVTDGDPLSAAPSFEVTVAVLNGLTAANLNFYLNGAEITPTPLIQTNSNTVNYAVYNPSLTAGTYILTVEVSDNQGGVSTKEVTNLRVQTSGGITLQGLPLNYPNPFDPGRETTAISYSLSQDSSVTIKFYDLTGNLVHSQNYSSGNSGGRAGYNEVTWDGQAGGAVVGNGIYIYLVLADGSLAQNGKGKITVFKR